MRIYDRSMRSGWAMVAASLNRPRWKLMEKDSNTKKDCDAYTAGVNEYIGELNEAAIALPLEYKLLDYRPEPWTNLKIGPFLSNTWPMTWPGATTILK